MHLAGSPDLYRVCEPLRAKLFEEFIADGGAKATEPLRTRRIPLKHGRPGCSGWPVGFTGNGGQCPFFGCHSASFCAFAGPQTVACSDSLLWLRSKWLSVTLSDAPKEYSFAPSLHQLGCLAAGCE